MSNEITDSRIGLEYNYIKHALEQKNLRLTPYLTNVDKKEIIENHTDHKIKKKYKVINYWLRQEVSKMFVYDYRTLIIEKEKSTLFSAPRQ